jgi:hypothetical protein
VKQGAAPELAMQETPTAKTLRRLGYTNLVFIREFNSPNGRALEVVLEKANAHAAPPAVD